MVRLRAVERLLSLARWHRGLLVAGGCRGVLAAPPPAMPPRRSTPTRPARCTRDADSLLNKGAYSDAAKKFEDLDRDHPYAPEARRAMVMAAYAYYKAGKYPEAHCRRQALHHHASRHQGRGAGPPHHRLCQLRRHQGSAPRPDRHAQGADRAEAAGAALPGQPLHQAGRQPHPHRRGHAGRDRDERRALLPQAQELTSAPSTASRRWSASTRPRRRSRRRSIASSRPT